MNPYVTNLIPCIRELNEANEVLRKRETLLQQLSLFRNVSQVGISNFFKWDSRISTGNAGDSVTIGIQNVSKHFTFHSTYWSFTVSRPKGGPSVNYKLYQDFTPGSQESFLLPLEVNEVLDSHDPKASSLNLSLNITFATNWSDLSFSKHLLIGVVELDVLHFLKTGRSSSSIVAFESLRKVQSQMESVRKPQRPPITSFSVSLNFDCARVITDELFRDAGSVSSVSGQSKLSRGGRSEFSAYIRDVKLVIQWIPELERLTVKCSDARLLYKLKQGLFRRLLLMCDSKKLNMIVKSDNGEQDIASVLYDLKMQLASIFASSKIDELELAQVYQDLQSLNESMLVFSL